MTPSTSTRAATAHEALAPAGLATRTTEDVQVVPLLDPPLRRPSVPLDRTAVVVVGELAVAAVLVADRLRRRPPSTRAHVVMGPGGWVSLKGGTTTVRPRERLWRRRRVTPDPVGAGLRPWWAKVLSARALQTLP